MTIIACAPSSDTGSSLACPPPRPVDDPSSTDRTRIRRATPSDHVEIVRMLGRCSEQTRLRRFHGLLAEFPEPYLTEALSGSLGHLALVIDTGEMISALASCRMVDEHVAELAILIEDARQRQGWGSRMLALLVAYADGAGWSTLRMTLLAEQAWILPTLHAYGQCRSRNSFGVIEAELSRYVPASGGHATLDSGPLASVGDLSLPTRHPAVDRRNS